MSNKKIIEIHLSLNFSYPVIWQVIWNIASGTLAILEIGILDGLIELAASNNGMYMPSWVFTRKYNGIQTLGSQGSTIHSPNITFNSIEYKQNTTNYRQNYFWVLKIHYHHDLVLFTKYSLICCCYSRSNMSGEEFYRQDGL